MSFSQEKRNYLHSKLDEVLRLWYRNAGQGYFNLAINDGVPEFQFGVYLDMGDGLHDNQEHSQPPQHVHAQASKSPHADIKHRHGRGPRRSPARQARNRRRAAAHQAALASKTAAESVVTAAATDNSSDTAAAAPTALFPGQGQILGTVARTTCHPSPPPPTVCTTLSVVVPSLTSVKCSLVSNITTSTTSSVPLPGQPAVTPPVLCNDELEGDESGDDDELFTFCGRCLKPFDADSDFGCCSRCVKAYHRSCAAGHICMSYL